MVGLWPERGKRAALRSRRLGEHPMCSSIAVVGAPRMRYILAGIYTTKSWPELSTWSEVLETSSIKWVPHTTHGFVPEIRIRNPYDDMRVGFAYLAEPFSPATISDLKKMPVESD